MDVVAVVVVPVLDGDTLHQLVLHHADIVDVGVVLNIRHVRSYNAPSVVFALVVVAVVWGMLQHIRHPLYDESAAVADGYETGWVQPFEQLENANAERAKRGT